MMPIVWMKGLALTVGPVVHDAGERLTATRLPENLQPTSL